ncbi:protein TALPID3-like [Gadus macrocephalus]|uniref:protein TALPID3-like n=1 Tax=Gadus macrocephalus TaxID=80720 RepID=UPI0028CB540F|nr:protein TALPID3-like [Gadus macrocephalus]
MRTFSWVPGESGLEDVSTCSSDAGNVLIRSTTTVLSTRSHHQDQSKPSHPDQSNPSHPDQSKPSPSDQSKPRPPVRVHPGIRKPGQRPQTSKKDKLKPGTSRSMVDHLVLTNQSPILVDQSRVLKEKSPLLVDHPPVLTDQSPVQTDQSPVQTDQSPVVLFSGQEVLTANHPFQGLQHRSHSAPRRLEGEVQFSDPVPNPETGCLSSCQQGAVTAATLAATAPLIQAQSQLEFRVSQLTDALRRFQEMKSPQDELSCRSSDHLLHRLEILQNQHLLLQRHLLDSTCKMSIGHAPVTPDPPSTLHLSPPAAPAHSGQAWPLLTNQRRPTKHMSSHSPGTSKETKDLRPAGTRRGASRVPISTRRVSGSRTQRANQVRKEPSI